MLTPILWSAVIQLAAWVTGDWIYQRLMRSPGEDEGVARAGIAMLLGVVALANAALALTILHLLYAPLLVCATVTLTALALWRLAPKIPQWRWRPSPEDIPLVLALLFMCVQLPRALYPVLEHDDNVYHLGLARHYLTTHAFDAPVFNVTGAMPHLVEVFQTIPLAFGDFVIPKVLTFSIHLWILVLLGGMVRARLGRLGVGVVALLYVLGPNVLWEFGAAHNEPFLGLFLVGAVVAFCAWWRSGRNVHLAIVGIACGATAASKYVDWPFVIVILGVCAVAIARRDIAPRRRLQHVVVIAVPCLALVLPWLVENALRTGNPVYPNAFGVFGGRWWSEIQQFHAWRSWNVRGGPRDIVSFVLIPWRLVTDPRLFFAEAFSGSLMAVFVIGVFRPKSYRGVDAYLQLIAIGGLLAWSLTVQGGRYIVAWLPVMAAAGMVQFRQRRVLLAVAAFALIVGFEQGRDRVRETLAMAKDVIFLPRDEIAVRNANWALCQFINRELPTNAKILGMWENRFFFLNRRFEADPLYEAPSGLAWLRQLDDPQRFAQALGSSGFTHVVVNPHVMAKYMDNALLFDLLDDRIYPARQLRRDRELWDAFAARYLEVVAWPGSEPEDETQRTLLYRIRPAV